ncbi:Ski-Like Protein [Manis pentadactyla]|nr:Ski-Like Protein [Manis pentadactyla]
MEVEMLSSSKAVKELTEEQQNLQKELESLQNEHAQRMEEFYVEQKDLEKKLEQILFIMRVYIHAHDFLIILFIVVIRKKRDSLIGIHKGIEHLEIYCLHYAAGSHSTCYVFISFSPEGYIVGILKT